MSKTKEIIEALHCWHPRLDCSSFTEGDKVKCCICGAKSTVKISPAKVKGHGKFYKENKAFAVDTTRCKVSRSYYRRLQNERHGF